MILTNSPHRSDLLHLLMLLMAGLTAAGCGAQESATPEPASMLQSVSQRYLGCVSPTADVDMFILSVAEGRDFTTGEPKDTPIPQKSELPEGAPPPVPPITVTVGTPGGGPTPTTKIVTYRLIGDGGKNLQDLVGHTVEVLGSPQPHRDDEGATHALMDALYVTSLRDLADYCK